MDSRRTPLRDGWSAGWRWQRICALLAALCLSASASADPPPATTDQPSAQRSDAVVSAELERRLQEWIVDLGSSEYATRRRAFMELWKQGPVALPAVRRALTTSDQQTVSTAKVLENLLKLDISPADNDELAELLQISASNWNRTLYSLGQKGHWRLAAAVLRSNTDLLNRMRDSYPPQFYSPLIQHAFDQGDAFLAWPTVAQALAPERRFYLNELTRKQLAKDYPNGLPREIEQALNAVSDESQLSNDERALLYLNTGRVQEAWNLNPSPRVKQRIVMQTGKWEWLKDPAVMPLTLGSVNDSLLRHARQAVFFRLADDKDKNAEAISKLRDELKAFNSGNENRKPLIAEIARMMTLGGEGDLTKELIDRGGVNLDIEYYNYQFQFDKILKRFGLDESLSNFDEWLVEIPGKLNPRGPQPIAGANSFESYSELLQFLARNGHTDQAQRLLTHLMDALRRSTINEAVEGWGAVAIRMRDHQLRTMFVNYLDENDDKLKVEERRLLLYQAFPEWQYSAEKIWQYAPAELAIVDGKRRRWRLLDRLWRYDRTLVSGDSDERVVETWFMNALRESAKSEDATDLAAGELARIAMKMGLRRLAITIVRTEVSRNMLSDMAEMLTVSNSFEAASKWWESAVRQTPYNHAWIRRFADVLIMQGEIELAKRYESSIWMRPLGSRMPQADEGSYSEIAEDYFEAGEYELAQQYATVAVDLTEQNERNVAARRLTQFAMETGDYKEAARASHIYAVNLLMSGVSLQRTRSDNLTLYMYYTSLQLLCSAAEDIQAGRIESAMADIARYESMLPSGIEICEHCYPLLVKAGHKAEADQLLERCAGRMLKHLEAWPSDSNSHNNLAWMLARCNSRIPEALEHARKAVEISQRSPIYLDTLAEAEYCAGHVERALELTQECIAADPRHAHFQKQLQRFRAELR